MRGLRLATLVHGLDARASLRGLRGVVAQQPGLPLERLDLAFRLRPRDLRGDLMLAGSVQRGFQPMLALPQLVDVGMFRAGIPDRGERPPQIVELQLMAPAFLDTAAQLLLDRRGLTFHALHPRLGRLQRLRGLFGLELGLNAPLRFLVDQHSPPVPPLTGLANLPRDVVQLPLQHRNPLQRLIPPRCQGQVALRQ